MLVGGEGRSEGSMSSHFRVPSSPQLVFQLNSHFLHDVVTVAKG